MKVAAITVKKDQNFLDQIRLGMYSSKNIFFNPSTLKFTDINISADLGEDFPSLEKSSPKVLKEQSNLGKRYHRVQTAVLDPGADEESKKVNNSPEYYYAAATARYNILFAQELRATIPCNTALQAGISINLQVESLTENKVQGVDQVRSGKYIISGLRHHFDSDQSTTSLKLIRSHYGLHLTES